MDWIMRNLGAILPLVIFFLIVRGVLRAIRQADKGKTAARRQLDGDPAAAERTRQIQEEIRRKIAERRAAAQSPTSPPQLPSMQQRIPPLTRPMTVSPLDPFGGPMRRPIKPQSAPQRSEDLPTAYVLERQRRLAEEMRALEAARQAEQQRAAEIAAVRTPAPAAGMPARPAAAPLIGRGDLRDPRALRRAIVLREILGPPVGLR